MSLKFLALGKVRICIVFAFYCISAYLVLFALNLQLPRVLENVIVWYALPLQAISMPWMGLLQSIGLTEGEWLRAPSFAGVLLLTFGYTFLLYIVISLPGLLAGAARR
jgi:hypothetical protein